MTPTPIAPGHGHRYLPWLAPLRVAAGWSQERLAATADVSCLTIRKVERGHAAKLQTVWKLANALGVSPRVLYAPSELLAAAGTGAAAGTYARRLRR